MAIAAAIELAQGAAERGVTEVVPRVATATAMRTQELGLARVTRTREEYIDGATQRITDSRRMLYVLVREGVIADIPAIS